jgi:hypothetical protein
MNERTTSEIAAGEQLGDFPFECDRSFCGHNQPRPQRPQSSSASRFTAGACLA